MRAFRRRTQIHPMPMLLAPGTSEIRNTCRQESRITSAPVHPSLLPAGTLDLPRCLAGRIDWPIHPSIPASLPTPAAGHAGFRSSFVTALGQSQQMQLLQTFAC